MSNLDKYKKVFIDSLSIDEKKLQGNLKFNEIPEWDSIGHMTLISGLEEAFKISMETDDVIDFSSFTRGKEILKKYKINL
mgnify:CR=1 FL=1|tara:strand:+ start:194 stop:433 length:240 start_codon:yes stop_codon:yes gene_type:complete